MNPVEMQSFIKVVECGTIQEAALQQGVPKSTISRRITRLEEALGIELLRRGSRSVHVTSEGRALYERIWRAFDDIEEAVRWAQEGSERPSGRLVLTAPAALSNAEVFVELLLDYKRRYPEVEIDVRLSEQISNVLQEGIDVALRGHREGELVGSSDLRVKRLKRGDVCFYASRTYLEERGVPEQLEDVTSSSSPHTLVCHRSFVDVTLSMSRDARGDEARQVSLHGSWVVNDFNLLARLLMKGEGIGLLPTFLVKGESVGGLCRVLPEWTLRSAGLSMIWAASRELSPRVRTFTALAEEHLSRL